MSDTRSKGLGFGTVLFLIFMTLKLTEHIDWSWWWVAAPLWLPVVVLLGIGGVAALLAALARARK